MTLFADELLEKLAARRAKQNNEMSFDPVAQKEREMIARYKNATNTFEKNMALNDLKLEYRKPISTAVSESGLLGIMDFEDAQQVAENTLRNIFDKFDLNQTVRPATYIIGRLKDELKRERYNTRDTTVRRSTENAMKNEYIKVAVPTLKKRYGREPSHQEVHDFITKDMGKQIDMKDIARNMALNRTVLSGNQQIGGQDTNAEFMTLMDMKDVSKQTPEDLLNRQTSEQHIDGLLNTNFNRNERKMLRSYYGLGQFKGKPLNANRAAGNASMTYYDAKKVIQRFEKLVDENDLDKDKE